MIEYEEKTLTCISCSKKVKRVVLKSRKLKHFLCQGCAKNAV